MGPSNNYPGIIANYYIESVKRLGGCCQKLIGDSGTENTIVGPLQRIFKDDSVEYMESSYQIVKSSFNQRIEAWWSMLRKRCTSWWITFFSDLVAFEGFNRADNTEVQCIRYCFMPVIQGQLNEICEVWENYSIALSRSTDVPNGKPFFCIMYHI